MIEKTGPITALEDPCPACVPEELDQSAEEYFVRHDLQRAAVEALGQLSDTDRQVLVATYWEESEAGPPAARKRRQRALERLRAAFRRWHGAD